MSTFSDMVVAVVAQTAPPRHRELIRRLGLCGRDLIKVVNELTRAGYAPTAHVMAAVLPMTSGLPAEALREGIAALDPSLTNVSFSADGVNSLTLNWLFLHNEGWVRMRAIEFLELRGEPTDYDIIQERFKDAGGVVRTAAYKAARTIAPGRLREILQAQLSDPDPDSRAAALDALKRSKLGFDVEQFAVESIPLVHASAAGSLFEWVHKHASHRLADAAVAAVKCAPGSEARLRAVETIHEWCTRRHVPELEKLAEDPVPAIRNGVMGVLMELAPKRHRPLIIRALRSSDPAARQEALSALRHDRDPLLVPDLLRLCRDEAPANRKDALTAVAKFDDVRVLSELVSAMNDVDLNVKNRASDLLNGRLDPVPVVNRFPNQPGEPPIWERLRDGADEVNKWAVEMGAELLGRHVVIHNYRQGLGRTWVRRDNAPVEIEVSDTPLTSLHPHGRQVMQALVLHELGHHVCDFGERGFHAVDKQSRRAGLAAMMNILLDERLERQLRSRRPEWGAYFDRLGAYAFARNERNVSIGAYAKLLEREVSDVERAIRRGEIPGRLLPPDAGEAELRVALRDRDMLRIPGLLPALIAFMMCFRCGFDPQSCADPRVAQAINKVPRNLKELPHAKLLPLAREIAEMIGAREDLSQELIALQKTVEDNPEVLGQLGEGLDRLVECNQLPGWQRKDAAKIRITPPSRTEIKREAPLHVQGGKDLNLGVDREFSKLLNQERRVPDPARHAALVAHIRPYIRNLRQHFEQLGRGEREHYAMRRGRRLDLGMAKRSAVRPSLNLLILEEETSFRNAYIGLLIDRSGSMAQGDKMNVAKRFGALLCEAARGLSGLEGHVSAFDHRTFYQLGNFEQNAISTLEPGGGNNDAGGLACAAGLAHASGKTRRLLIMISDGSPTQCTFESLKRLVERLRREHGIRCVQIALEPMTNVAFPQFVDVSGLEMPQAVRSFVRLLLKNTADWR